MTSDDLGNKSRQNKRQVLVAEGLFHHPASPNEKPYLFGSKCRLCGYVSFPRRQVCPICVKDNTMDELALSNRGKVYSFSVSRVAPPGFSAPYIQAYVDLPEGPRVFSLITGCEPLEGSLEIGAEVELIIDKVSEDEEGNDVIGYKFRLVG